MVGYLCKTFVLIVQLHHDQVQMMLDAFKNPPQTREEGIYFDDQQYKCVRADKNSIYGKCVSIHLLGALCADMHKEDYYIYSISNMGVLEWLSFNINFLIGWI